MSALVYLSEGPGLMMLAAALLCIVAGTGIAVHRSAKKQLFGEILLPCSMIALSILFLFITFGFPSEEAGPSAVPRLWIFWLCVLSGAIIWQTLKRKDIEVKESGRLGFLLFVTLILVAYYFAMQIIGYFLSTFIFLVLMMHVLSYKRKLVIITVASGWIGFSYLVFYKLLYIQLPLGYFEYYF
jgi:hypothetical protein